VHLFCNLSSHVIRIHIFRKFIKIRLYFFWSLYKPLNDEKESKSIFLSKVSPFHKEHLFFKVPKLRAFVLLNADECRELVGIYWQGKTKVLGGKPFSLLLWSPRISYGYTWNSTRASAVTWRQQTAWSITRNSKTNRDYLEMHFVPRSKHIPPRL